MYALLTGPDLEHFYLCESNNYLFITSSFHKHFLIQCLRDLI